MILIKPYMTEKTLAQGVFNRFAFLVEPSANKHQIKEAVEAHFKVNVIKVWTHRARALHGRSYRTGRTVTQKPNSKVAIVELKDKQTIDLFKTK